MTTRPTHRVYAVTKNGEKEFWQPVGAMWAHGDGKSFSLRLDYLPLNDAKLSVRVTANRAASADAALLAYIRRTHCGCEDCLADLLCDLMHWADKCRFSFAEELRRANSNYAAETADKEAA